MIPLATPLALQGIGTVASLFGSHKANSEQQKLLDEQRKRIEEEQNNFYKDKSKLESWKLKNSGNYLDTSEGSGILTQLKENAREQNDAVANNAAITGASNASITAQKKSSQNTFTDALRKLAGYGTQWKSSIDNKYFNQSNNLNKQKNAINNALSNNDLQQQKAEQNKSQQWANFAKSLGSMGLSAAISGAGKEGGTGVKDWLSNLFNKGVDTDTVKQNLGFDLSSITNQPEYNY